MWITPFITCFHFWLVLKCSDSWTWSLKVPYNQTIPADMTPTIPNLPWNWPVGSEIIGADPEEDISSITMNTFSPYEIMFFTGTHATSSFLWVCFGCLHVFIEHFNDILTNSTKYSPIKQTFDFHWFRKASSNFYLGNILSSSSRWGMCGTGGLSKCSRVRNTDPAWARNLSIFSADCWASQHIICLQL